MNPTQTSNMGFGKVIRTGGSSGLALVMTGKKSLQDQIADGEAKVEVTHE